MGAAPPAAVLADNAISKLPNDVWIYTGLLALALLIGAAIIAVFERWRKRQGNETFTAHDQLAQFRLLYERGELDPQEFDRIKKQLLVKLKTGNPAAVAAPEVIEPKESPPEGQRSEVRDQKSEQQSPDVPPPPADNGAEK
jgi:hypothetical protein